VGGPFPELVIISHCLTCFRTDPDDIRLRCRYVVHYSDSINTHTLTLAQSESDRIVTNMLLGQFYCVRKISILTTLGFADDQER
jgi:hypothetical protein